MEQIKVTDLVKKIDTEKTQSSASKADEISVMRAMLNDPDYKVDIYGKSGVEGQYCPREDAVVIATDILAGAGSIPKAEAQTLAAGYEFTKADATAMVGISKEFINTYLHTGRKLPLGKREKSDVSLKLKIKPESVSTFPIKTGVNPDGTPAYSKQSTKVPSYETLSVAGSCPSWLK